MCYTVSSPRQFCFQVIVFSNVMYVCSAVLMLHIQYDHFYKTNRDLQGDYIASRV